MIKIPQDALRRLISENTVCKCFFDDTRSRSVTAETVIEIRIQTAGSVYLLDNYLIYTEESKLAGRYSFIIYAEEDERIQAVMRLTAAGIPIRITNEEE